MQRPLRALFFDFDGVIVDSIKTKTKAFNVLFKDYPNEVIQNVLDYHRQHGGISRVDKIAHAHEHFIGSPISKADLKVWSDHYSELVVEKVIKVAWIDGAIEFLESVHSEPVKIFVISGTPETELQLIIDKREIAGYFHECLGSPTRKPVHIRSLLEKYQLEPSECVFIGDALTDYDAAMETGLHFVGIRGEVDFPAGTVVLEDCTDLKQAIDNIFDSNSSRQS